VDQEQKWIRAIQRRGSRRAAEELVDAYYDEIYRFACRQTGDREDAMDLTQNIFLAVLRALSTYDRRRAGFRTWLYRIAANKAVDARRRAGPATVPIDELDLPAAEDFAMAVQDRELLERIESYVSGLDPGIQAVFRLHLYGEKSFPEIAAILDQSESAVKSQYYRLLGRLRKEFDPNG
jgi:RNA polymerase sigma-70 factor (ECF subfamily)